MNMFFKQAFKRLKMEGLFLFGVYPVDNPFFMSNKVTTDLRFIVGPFWGKVNRRSVKLTIDPHGEKEDSERTLKHYVKDSGVLRFNNVCIKTTFYKPKGGLQSWNRDRKKESLVSAKLLVKSFPGLATLYFRKNGHPELRLKDRRN